MEITCEISGKQFQVSDHEIALRKQFGFGDSLPKVSPKYRIQQVGAFWPHWNLHKRKCDKTGKQIISIFRPDCKYPVWHRDEWIAHANPPSADFDFSRPFFEQAWELFQKCPIPHAFQSHNQNCEYTDDWYYSKNCYLCHSGQSNEDCRYCYGCDSIKNIHYGVFCFESEFCMDLINSIRCHSSLFLLNCKNVSSSAFLYDCRDCENCMFCFNLRHKKYCFGNEQLTKEEFEKRKKEWDFSSLENYQKAKKFFSEMMETLAWHRALQIDKCENSSGNFIHNCKDCENCYLLSYHENCANTAFSGPHAKSTLDSVGTVGGEISFMSSLPVYCYDAKFCFSTSHCRFTQYCGYLQNCHYCFGCCGLVNEEYCILNKKYAKEEYENLVSKIIEHMGGIPASARRERETEERTGLVGSRPNEVEPKNKEYGEFFPKHFAPNPYEESFSGFHFPIETKRSEKPFQVQQADIDFAKKMNFPLPYNYYIDHMQENLKWMPFNGELRETTCAKSGKKILTNWPALYNKRILSEKEYLKFIK